MIRKSQLLPFDYNALANRKHSLKLKASIYSILKNLRKATRNNLCQKQLI